MNTSCVQVFIFVDNPVFELLKILTWFEISSKNLEMNIKFCRLIIYIKYAFITPNLTPPYFWLQVNHWRCYLTDKTTSLFCCDVIKNNEIGFSLAIRHRGFRLNEPYDGFCVTAMLFGGICETLVLCVEDIYSDFVFVYIYHLY